MSEKKESKSEDNGYLFSVEILIQDKTNGHALEKLTHLLNTDEISDYRIINGINLGHVIEAAQKLSKEAEAKKGGKPASSKPASPPVKSVPSPLITQIQQFIQERKLVRLSIVKMKGIKLSIPCRILNYDSNSGHITVYHVDEKKVYQYNINEIDDLT